MMAELLNSDGIVVKTKGEGFAIWLLKLYIMSCRSAHLDLTDEYKEIYSKIFESLKEKLDKQKRFSGS